MPDPGSGSAIDRINNDLERFRAKWIPGSREENASKQSFGVFDRFCEAAEGP